MFRRGRTRASPRRDGARPQDARRTPRGWVPVTKKKLSNNYNACVGDIALVTIYRIINWCNGRCYVGQTAGDVDYRFRKHCKANSVIGRAIRYYGVENFTVEVIEVCADEIANEREQFWIRYYNCFVPFGYNVSRRGHFPKPKKQQ